MKLTSAETIPQRIAFSSRSIRFLPPKHGWSEGNGYRISEREWEGLKRYAEDFSGHITNSYKSYAARESTPGGKPKFP